MIRRNKTSKQKLEKKAKKGFKGFPMATIAYYGPTNKKATKVAVGIVPNKDAEPDIMKKWFSENKDIRLEEAVYEAILQFIQENNAASIVLTDRIIGCPHEQGIDYEDDWCPECLFWEGVDRWTGLPLN